MSNDVRTCELCGSTENISRGWIATHDENGAITEWVVGLLCRACRARQEQPPEFIGDPETFADMDEPGAAAAPAPPLPAPPARLGFKALTLENWRQPDPVSAAFAGVSPLDGQFGSLSGDDWAYHVLAIPLAESVPEELRRLFEVARGTMLYGWFFYPAFTLASEQVLRVADAAVARRCRELESPRSVRTLDKRLTWLGERGDLSAEDLYRWDAVRHLRNLTSHPEDQNVLPPGMVISQLRLLAEAIGSLFARATDASLAEEDQANA